MNDANKMSRQTWLETAVKHAAPEFNKHGYAVPEVRISCGFPSTGQRGSRIGECWSTKICSGGLNEIFISPLIDDSDEVLGIIFHELVHAVDDCKSGHGAAFKKLIPKTRITIKRQRPYAECSECGYRVPMLKKFLDAGPPICPKDNIMMMPEGQWD